VRGLRWTLATLLAAAALIGGVCGACGASGLLQGDSFEPDGALPTEPASDRFDASACDGAATCDAGPPDSAPILPVADGAAPPSNTCEAPRDIGTVSGDTGSQTLTATGGCSEWLTLRATEDNSSALGAAMKVTLTLVSQGHDFDLYAYFNPAKDVISCTAPFARSETRGLADELINLTWGEGTVANGSDDSRTINVAVQSAAGPCPPTASWTLLVAGNR
jgi:hypothetical protein